MTSTGDIGQRMSDCGISHLLIELDKAYRSLEGLSDTVLNLPATQSDIAEYEELLGFQMCNELRSLFLCSNGSRGISVDPFPVPRDSLFLTHPFSSLEQSAVDYKKLTEMGGFEKRGKFFEEKISSDRFANHHRVNAIKREPYSSKWIPIGNNRTGAYIIVDHDPGEGGVVGQVIFLDVLTEMVLVSDSIRDYLRLLLDNQDTLFSTEDSHSELIRIATRRSRVMHFFKRL